MEKPKRKRVYVPGEWARRGRVDPRSKSRTIGRPPIYKTAERKRLARLMYSDRFEVRALYRAWRSEPFTRCKAEMLAAAAHEAYGEWFDALDGDET